MIKMKFFAALFLPALVCAAILPDDIGAYHRTGTAPAAMTDRPVWNEYGLQASESATYRNNAEPTTSGGAAPVKKRVALSQRVTGEQFTVTAWQLQDTTGSLARFRLAAPGGCDPLHGAANWRRRRQTPPAGMRQLSAPLRRLQALQRGTGCPDRVAQATWMPPCLPVLPGYLPSGRLVPNSERYITGPAALAEIRSRAFRPRWPAFISGRKRKWGFSTAPRAIRQW